MTEIDFVMDDTDRWLFDSKHTIENMYVFRFMGE